MNWYRVYWFDNKGKGYLIGLAPNKEWAEAMVVAYQRLFPNTGGIGFGWKAPGVI